MKTFNKMKRWACILMAVLLFVTLTMVPASAIGTDSVENAIKAALIEKICNNYAEYYTIPSISAEVVSKQESTNVATYTIEVSLQRVLRADCAADLPYIQGALTEALQLNVTRRNAVLNDLTHLIDEIDNEYIDKKQSENGLYQVTFSTRSNESMTGKLQNAVFSVVEMNGICFPIESLKPATPRELRESGKTYVRTYTEKSVIDSYKQEELSEREKVITNSMSSAAQDYDRVKARDYIRQYCCNSGIAHTCPNRNTAYSYLSSDCANYVSQAIRFGGIETDSIWQPYTTAWANVGAPYNPNLSGNSHQGVSKYMLENNYFFQTTNKMKAFAGSIVYWYGQHVGMVDQNDTVTMTYCAHNVCRKQAPFSSNWVYGFYGYYTSGTESVGKVSFLVPTWDSYAGTWTNQN